MVMIWEETLAQLTFLLENTMVPSWELSVALLRMLEVQLLLRLGAIFQKESARYGSPPGILHGLKFQNQAKDKGEEGHLEAWLQ